MTIRELPRHIRRRILRREFIRPGARRDILLPTRKAKPPFFGGDSASERYRQLHMGHALDETPQDILVRYKRMQDTIPFGFRERTMRESRPR